MPAEFMTRPCPSCEAMLTRQAELVLHLRKLVKEFHATHASSATPHWWKCAQPLCLVTRQLIEDSPTPQK